MVVAAAMNQKTWRAYHTFVVASGGRKVEVEEQTLMNHSYTKVKAFDSDLSSWEDIENTEDTCREAEPALEIVEAQETLGEQSTDSEHLGFASAMETLATTLLLSLETGKLS